MGFPFGIETYADIQRHFGDSQSEEDGLPVWD